MTKRPKPEPMTEEELRAFIAEAPFRAVKGIPEGPLNKPPDPHEYFILGWQKASNADFFRFVATIRQRGYQGRYVAPYSGRSMINRYLQVGDWCYWYIGPKMMNRCRADAKQHEPLEEQLTIA